MGSTMGSPLQFFLRNSEKYATPKIMLWSSYLSGLVLGVGVCSLHCSLLLLPVTARLNTTWQDGLRTVLLFSSGKVLTLSLYGGLAVALGLLVYDLLNHTWIRLGAGLFVAGMGIWFLMKSGSCGNIARRGSPFLLGLIEGAVPCLATAGFLLYLATQGGSVISGVLNGFVFGLGTATGPLLPICALAPHLWRRLAGNRTAQLVLRTTGAVVYFIWAWFMLTGG